MSKEKYYIKLPYYILEDYSIATLSDYHWVTFIKLLFIANDFDRNGALPANLERWLNISKDELAEITKELSGRELIYAFTDSRAQWRINNFWNYEGEKRDYKYIASKIYERDDYACVYCGDFADTIDHIIPQIHGGSDKTGNLVACCKSCNSRKGGRTPLEAGMLIKWRRDEEIMDQD